MLHWFEELSRNRRNWVDATRANQFESGIIGTIVHKYADPTHFIYELIQNAEDQEATEVEFVISQDNMTFCHNGQPFLREDVESITGIGNSEKPKEANKIGRFGIGFKSVFQVTARPTIACLLDGKPFRFAIEDLVVPVPLDIDESHDNPQVTRFTLPFRREVGDQERCEIERKVSHLDPTTLLFLDHIQKVHWRSGERVGEYIRDCKEASIVTLTERESAVGESRQAYLVFRRDLAIEGSDRPSQSVQLAFRLDDEGRIRAEEKGTPLHVFFETEERTGLMFRVHGPFLLTDNRANIKRKEPTNDRLIRECEKLFVEALGRLRDTGLLTPDCLAVLPNDGDDLAECCRPLRSAMIEAMRIEAVVPAHDGGHAPASQMVRGPQPIRACIDRERLAWLAKNPEICWASGVMANSRQERLLESLGIRSWGWDQLLRCVEDRFHVSYARSVEAESFLVGQSDAWIQKFYMVLGSAFQHRRYTGSGSLQLGDDFLMPREWALVRTQIGQHQSGGKVFLPEGAADYDLGSILLVKPELLQGKDKESRERVVAFLKVVGAREIGQKERIKSLLETRYSPQSGGVTSQDNARHMRLFLDYFRDERRPHFQ